MARHITVLGAGLVGSLLSILLKKRGYDVTVYERRPDMRSTQLSAGRSINLAMSARGWRALDLAGLREDIESLAIPMYGRYLHQADGSSALQYYGANNEAIYSVSRGELNKRLMSLAEEHGVTINFEHRCNSVDVANNVLEIEKPDGSVENVHAEILLGADGAHSALRRSYTYLDRVDAQHFYLKHGYKELSIPPLADGSLQIEEDGLHIWPRKNFMMIALPNTDGNFTCTLFLPFEGEQSFEQLKTDEQIIAFFKEQFPDALPKMPTLIEDFNENPTSSLITTFIDPWYYNDKNAVIGDAAHGIVPFYGQGMNAGFEDCTILAGLMDEHGDDWATILPEYDKLRRVNGFAVAELALKNFVEMRDKVADKSFLLRKKIEKELVRRYPKEFISVYEMVSFTHIPYSTAKSCIEAQDQLLHQIMSEGDFFTNIENEGFTKQLDNWVADYHQSVKDLDFGDNV